MSEAQGWTLLGIVAAALLAGPTVLVLYLRTALAALTQVMEARFEKVEVRFEAMDEVMRARFDAVDVRLAALDRDVQALVSRALGQ
jgi:hypothetical protein